MRFEEDFMLIWGLAYMRFGEKIRLLICGPNRECGCIIGKAFKNVWKLHLVTKNSVERRLRRAKMAFQEKTRF